MAWKSSFTTYSMRKTEEWTCATCLLALQRKKVKWERLSACAATWSFHNFPIKLCLNTDIADGTCISCNERKVKNINHLNLEQLLEGFLWKFNHFPPEGKDFYMSSRCEMKEETYFMNHLSEKANKKNFALQANWIITPTASHIKKQDGVFMNNQDFLSYLSKLAFEVPFKWPYIII